MAMNISRRTLIKGTAGITAASAFGVRGAWAQAETIRIGFIAPLSGAAQSVGAPLRFGAEVAVAQINAAGGIAGKQVELVVRDDKGDPTQAVAAVREMVGNGINLIVGVPLTACALAVTGVIEAIDGILIGTGSGEESLTHELFHRHFFTAAPNNYVRNGSAAKFMSERYGDVTTWTSVFPDNTIGYASWDRMAYGLNEHYGAAGKQITIADPVITKYGATDFKPQIVKLMSSPASGLHCVLFGNDGVNFFQQAKQFGLDKKFNVIVEQALDLDLPKALKSSMTANTWTLSYWNPAAFPDNAQSQALLDAYTAATNDANPHAFMSLSHTAVRAFATALTMTEGNTDTAAMIDALEAAQFDTATGPALFRKEDHQIVNHGVIFNAVSDPSDKGWALNEVLSVDFGAVINPATPGVKFQL